MPSSIEKMRSVADTERVPLDPKIFKAIFGAFNKKLLKSVDKNTSVSINESLRYELINAKEGNLVKGRNTSDKSKKETVEKIKDASISDLLLLYSVSRFIDPSFGNFVKKETDKSSAEGNILKFVFFKMICDIETFVPAI